MKLKSLFRLLFLVALMSGFLQISFWPGSGSEFVEVDVKAGSHAGQVAKQLMDVGLIQSPLYFKVWIRLRLAAGSIHVGRYRFSKGRSAFWIVDDLIHGRTEKAKFVIPEGFASWQIAERLEEMKICLAADFKREVQARKAEGFLFPATYNLEFGLTADELVRIFQGQFEKMWNQEFQIRTKERGWSRLQAITLASIIEREVRVRSELPMISAVYNNRLKQGMRLEADPTVQFALGYWKTRLTNNDYKRVNSPYNTYLHMGFPPGPICSPGVDAIRAALWPADSDALFMLAKDDGFHTYSTTYREHKNKVYARDRSRKK